MKDNLYLVITIYHQPQKGLRTEKSTIYDEPNKGRRTKDTSWTLNPHAWNDIEIPELVSRVSLNKLRTSAVVIDLKNDKLIRNRFEKNDPADILKHFKTKYAQYLPGYTKPEEVITEESTNV